MIGGRARHRVHRAKWLIAFTLTLLASSVAPVFATGEGGGESAAGEAQPPSPAEIAELESQELEYAEWLSSPEAISQREASQSAYGSLTAGEARELVLDAFPEELNALNADPARVLSELEIEKPLGTYAALISDQQGERSIVESSVPVESTLGGEGKQPVDLTLEQSGTDFVPKNPVTEVTLPGSAEGPIRLQSGLEVELPSVNDHSAQSLGDMNLFYPETETATDTLISPIAGGVEVFEQLRSPESPEQFHFDLDLPAGATLAETEAGGVEILSASSDLIGKVPPPSAFDAQGTLVPVEMSVEDTSLLLDVPHRSLESAYPILVDPPFLEEGYVSYNQWSPASTDAYNLSNTSNLSAQAKGGSYTYGANTHGHLVYTAPGQTTYIAAATFFSNSFNLPSSCATEQPTNQPHGYAGLYNPSSGGYVGRGIWSGGSSSSPAYQTGWVGSPGVRQAVVGIGTGASSVHHKCAFTFSVGGVTIQESDPEAPTVNWLSGTSSKWVKDITITANASDPGLGVKGITLSPGGALPHTDNMGGCSGAYTSRCPASGQASFGVGYFAEGERSASISAYDPLGPDNEAHVSSSFQWTTKLDRGKPEVALEGQLAEAIEEAEGEGEVSEEEVPRLSLPVYNLQIEAEDGSNAEGKTKRSGVKDIAVFVDGEEMEVLWSPQECPTSSCSMTKTYPVHLNGLEGDPVHQLKVIAEDQVGNAREREIEFEYIPATGMKDEYVMQYFPLPDGQGKEEEEEHPSRPELAVNVVNGNLVYRQKDVDVEGPAVDLEVERFYNSQQPEEDSTEWGDGWTLAQTPELELEETKEETPPVKASMVRTSGIRESSVGLPTKSGGTQFDKKLQAVVTKDPGGGYTVEDQSGETDTSLVFDEAGKVKELQTSGYADIEYSYDKGDLSEMAVDDPASAYLTPEQLEELRNEPSEWATQATVSPEARTELKLTDVSCTSATKCMAVGYDKFMGRTFAESWDGSAWKITYSNLGTSTEPAVSCVGPSSCHIVATDAGGTAGTWGLFSWGSTFRAFVAPEGASSWKLRDVSCSSETACTAVGYAYVSGKYKTLVERYDGTSWSIQKSIEPSEGNGFRAMSSVSCASSTHCLAVGEAAGKPFAEEWDGAKWTPVSIPGSAEGFLEDVSCVSATSCMAVGHHGWWEWMGESWQSSTLAVSWDGSEWSEIETPEPSEELLVSGATLSGVSCLTTSSCIAVGSFSAKGEAGAEERTLAEIWDGSEWVIQSSTSPDVFSILAGISCTATTQCTAVGSARPVNKDTNNMVTLGERWVGSEWVTQATVSPEARTELNLTDVSCTSATKCMAVGYNKFMGRTFAESWDGSAWKIVQSNLGTGTEPTVSCVGLPYCHIVASTANGTHGTWIYFQPGGGSNWGSTFRTFATPEGASSWKLRDVSCSSETACTAVGYAYVSGKYKTLVERYDGTTWSIQESPEPSKGNGYNALASVSCPTVQYCLAVGKADSKPFAEKWNGSKWELAPVGVSEAGTLEDVSCVSATSCTAVGYLGSWEWSGGSWWVQSGTLIESWDGSEWTEIEAPEPSEEPLASDARLSAVSCASTISCLAVGAFLTDEGEQGKEEKALAETWNGSEWVTHPSAVSPAVFSALAGVSCTATSQCAGVGAARPEFNGTNNMVTLGEKIKPAPEPTGDDDPSVDVNVTYGLVTAVEGDDASQIVYAHDDELLTAVAGFGGETEYEYDSEKRLTKVTLPNGSWGQVAYNEADGRVKSVTVDPAGEGPAKTTYFAYQDSPSRRTTVSPEGDPATIYDIGADGSVLKWWNTPTPPELETLSGSLYQNKESAEAIAPGDYALSIKAHSAEGIASIEVIANGSTLVDEKTCEQEWETPERECQTVEEPWITNTGNWPPGILNLEILVTDANGNVESAKFWVNIPYTPPPDPEADGPPTFEDVLHFREEFGLDLDLKGDEQAINERIFDLIGAWYNPNTPNGEIARATYERWGVPLRAVDAAELDYRDRYVSADVAAIEEWAQANYPNTYGGYYVDHRAGGVLYVGFTQDQGARLGQIKQYLPLLAGDRLAVYPEPPTTPLVSLHSAYDVLNAALDTNPTFQSLVTDLSIDESENDLSIGTTNVPQTKAIITQLVGSQVPVNIFSGAELIPMSGRNRTSGRMRAGDRILNISQKCTAGFGAYENRKKKSNGESIKAEFLLTAGHCFSIDSFVHRSSTEEFPEDEDNWGPVGQVTRNALYGIRGTDGLAIRVKIPDIVPRGIFGSIGNLIPTGSPTQAKVGNTVCFSGSVLKGGSCGSVKKKTRGILLGVQTGFYITEFSKYPSVGDSGSPVWNPRTGAAVGVITGHYEGTPYTAVTPLLHLDGFNSSQIPGILHDPDLSGLHLVTGDGS
jgi:YD repeat-containing protein